VPSPFESAQLILQLFEMRREPVLREARRWFVKEFNPATFEDVVAGATAKNDAFRMVIGYWDMAASLVNAGAIDADMFRAANNEIFAAYAKVEPFMAELRAATGIPEFGRHMESVVMGLPQATERLALLRAQWGESESEREKGKGKREK
jgi:hypothetical protein